MSVKEMRSKLVLEGEREYRAGLDDAYKSVSQLSRQLKVTDAAYIDNGNSMAAQKARSEVLRKEIEAQKNVIRSLTERMKYCDNAYKGNTEAQEVYAKKVAKAMRTLGNMERELSKSEEAIGKASVFASKSVEKLSGGFTVLKGIVSNLAADALRKGASALNNFVKDGIALGSDLEEVDNVISTAFGSATAEVKAFADNAMSQYGLASLSAQSYAGKLGAAFNALGLQSRAQEMSTTLTGLTGDLSSFWNLSSDEMYTKIFSGVISGETEGLKSLGIVMTDTNLQAFALEQGIKKKTAAMTAAEKADLRYRYVLNATKQAQGDFAKTAGSYANQMRVATLQTDNAKAALGQRLLPTITSVIGKFNEWMKGDYAKKLLRDASDAAADFADGALTALRDGLAWVLEHLDAIKKAAAAIGIGFLAAKIMGFLLTMKGLVAALMKASKAQGLLNAAMAMNPAAAIGIAVAALAVGVFSLIGSFTTMSDKLKNIKLEVPQTSVDAVTNGIQKGIDAADKVHEIEIAVKVDTTKLQEALAGIFADDKFTLKEKNVNLKGVRSSYKDDQKLALSGAIGEVGKTLATDLQAAYDEYNTLLTKIYDGRESATTQELEALNGVLEKIGLIRSEIQAATSDAISAQKGTYARVMSGLGSEEDFGAAVGYVQQEWANKALVEQEAYNAKIDEVNVKIADGLITTQQGQDAIDKLKTDYESKTEGAKGNLQERIQEIFNAFSDGAKNKDVMAGVEKLAKLRDDYVAIVAAWSSGDGFDENEIESLLTPERIEKYLGMNEGDYDLSSLKEKGGTMLTQMLSGIEQQIADTAPMLDNNPVMAWLQAMMDAGSLDQLNTATLSGNLAEALKAVDFVGAAKTLGGNAFDGITKGMGDGADGMTPEDAAGVRNSLLTNLRAALDCHSPAKTTIPIGEDVTGGVAFGMTDKTALSSIADAITAIKAAISGAFDMTDAGKEGVTDLGKGMDSKKSSATSKAKSVANAAKDAANMRSGFYSVGRNVMSEYIAGIESKKQAVTDAIKAMMQSSITAAKKALRVASPSKVFAEIGGFTAEGFEQGFGNRMDRVDRTISARLSAVAKTPEPRSSSPAANTPRGSSEGFHFTQNVYANKTSYAAQQREAARQFRKIARGLST